MATYPYHCTNPKCGHEWEAEHGMNVDPLKKCPKCKKKTAKRDIAETSFTLKGSGWADDGYSQKFNPET